MSFWAKSGGLGSILVLIALVITFIKQLIAFVGFLTFAIKAVILLAFIALFVGVAFLVFRSWSQSKHRRENV